MAATLLLPRSLPAPDGTMLRDRVTATARAHPLPLASEDSRARPMPPRRRPRAEKSPTMRGVRAASSSCSSGGDDASPSSSSSPSSSDDLPSLKSELLRLVARIDEKGNSADPSVSDAERRAVLKAVEALEARNPTPRPAAAPAASRLLSGEWALLYVGPGAVPEETEEEEEKERLASAAAAAAKEAEKEGGGNKAGAEWRRRSGGLEGPVLSALSPLALKGRLVKRTGVSQVIDADAGTISNVAGFALFDGKRKGYLDVTGSVKKAEGSDTRVDVAFEAAEICVPPLLKLTIPLSWASPKGWVET